MDVVLACGRGDAAFAVGDGWRMCGGGVGEGAGGIWWWLWQQDGMVTKGVWHGRTRGGGKYGGRGIWERRG
ncbi:hypothetical protein Tco_0953519 [Tanacetum coccineum]|uniref:Uncharacterized protein n=1 Tax=Tanacetum coccineum TaxID=301880 RepID=A0ABQ5E427_9ASTR